MKAEMGLQGLRRNSEQAEGQDMQKVSKQKPNSNPCQNQKKLKVADVEEKAEFKNRWQVLLEMFNVGVAN